MLRHENIASDRVGVFYKHRYRLRRGENSALSDIVDRDAQSRRELLECVDRALSSSGLDLGEIGRRDARRLGQSLDGQSSVLAPNSDLVLAVDHAIDVLSRDQLLLTAREPAVELADGRKIAVLLLGLDQGAIVRFRQNHE